MTATPCPSCGRTPPPSRLPREFCSERCRNLWHSDNRKLMQFIRRLLIKPGELRRWVANRNACTPRQTAARGDADV